MRIDDLKKAIAASEDGEVTVSDGIRRYAIPYHCFPTNGGLVFIIDSWSETKETQRAELEQCELESPTGPSEE